VVPEEEETEIAALKQNDLHLKTKLAATEKQIELLEIRVRELSEYNEELRSMLEKEGSPSDDHDKSCINNLLDLENKFNILVVENDKLSQALMERNSESNLITVKNSFSHILL
jgi:chromosome segregation ATPase